MRERGAKKWYAKVRAGPGGRGCERVTYVGQTSGLIVAGDARMDASSSPSLLTGTAELPKVNFVSLCCWCSGGLSRRRL